MKSQLLKYSSLLTILLASFLLTGCLQSLIYDDYNEDPVEEPKDENATYYFALNIYDAGNSDGTRADDPLDSDSDDNRFDSDFEDEELEGDIFNKGLAAEKALYPAFGLYERSPHYIMFFDKDGNKVGNMLALSLWKNTNTNASEDDPYWTSYKTLYAAISDADRFKVLENTDLKVLVVLNATAALEIKLKNAENYTQTLSVLAEPSGTDTGSDFLFLTDGSGNRYFTMSSSMVVKTAVNGSKSATAATDGEFKFYPSQQEALNKPFSMYVERLQAKYTVLFKSKKDNDKYYYFDTKTSSSTKYLAKTTYQALVFTAGTDFTPGTKYETLKFVSDYTRSQSIANVNPVHIQETNEWKVNIAGWSVNGLEKKEYLFKHIDANKTYYVNWHPLSYRNYWAEDNSYNSLADIYPDQYRPVLYSHGEPVDENVPVTSWNPNATLNYYPYSTLRKRSTHQYSPESTFDISIFTGLSKPLTSKAHVRAGTHLIIGAQLIIKGLDDEGVYNSERLNNNSHIISGTDRSKTTDVICKLLMDGVYWKEIAYKNYAVEYIGYHMLENQEPVNEDGTGGFGPNDGNIYVGISDDPSNKRLADGDHFDVVAIEIEGGDGYVRIAPHKNNKGETEYSYYTYDPTIYYDDNGNEIIKPERERYTVIPIDKLNALIISQPRYYAGHYYFGRMYYSVPVRHNNLNSTLTDVNFATGDFGSVRNHWYYFTVENINCPGTPVADPAQPIIPNNEPEYETLGVSMHILRWHSESTDVDINDQLGNITKPGGSNSGNSGSGS